MIAEHEDKKHYDKPAKLPRPNASDNRGCSDHSSFRDSAEDALHLAIQYVFSNALSPSTVFYSVCFGNCTWLGTRGNCIRCNCDCAYSEMEENASCRTMSRVL